MKIYIAASFAARERLRPIRDQLFRLGHDVMSSWLDEVAKPVYAAQATFDRKLALKDMVEAGSADLIILDTLTPSTTGGSHVEFGIGLARFQRQLLYVVGPYSNIFQRLADTQFDTWDECLYFLETGSEREKLNVSPTTCLTPSEQAQLATWDAKMAWLACEESND